MPKSDFSKWVKTGDIAETISFILSAPAGHLRETVLKAYGDA
jgi:hypothetical protein